MASASGPGLPLTLFRSYVTCQVSIILSFNYHRPTLLFGSSFDKGANDRGEDQEDPNKLTFFDPVTKARVEHRKIVEENATRSVEEGAISTEQLIRRIPTLSRKCEALAEDELEPSKPICSSTLKNGEEFPNPAIDLQKPKPQPVSPKHTENAKTAWSPPSLKVRNAKESSQPRQIKKFPSAPMLQTQKRAIERDEREKRTRHETSVRRRGDEHVRASRPAQLSELSNEPSQEPRIAFKQRTPTKPKLQPASTKSGPAQGRDMLGSPESTKPALPSPSQQTNPKAVAQQIGWAAATPMLRAGPNPFVKFEHEDGQKKKKESSVGRSSKNAGKANTKAQKSTTMSEEGQLDTPWEQRRSREETQILHEDRQTPIAAPPGPQLCPSSMDFPSSGSSRSKPPKWAPQTSIAVMSPASTNSSPQRLQATPLLRKELLSIPLPEISFGKPGFTNNASPRKPLQSFPALYEANLSSETPSSSITQSYGEDMGNSRQEATSSLRNRSISEGLTKGSVTRFRRIFELDGFLAGCVPKDPELTVSKTSDENDATDKESLKRRPTKEVNSVELAQNVSSDEKGKGMPEPESALGATEAHQQIDSPPPKSQLRGNAKRFNTPPGFRERSERRSKYEASERDDSTSGERTGPNERHGENSFLGEDHYGFQEFLHQSNLGAQGCQPALPGEGTQSGEGKDSFLFFLGRVLRLIRS